MKQITKNKRSQAELITTILLILVAIVAVGLVATFVVRMVTDYLKPTDCFKTTGQLTINTEDGYTYYENSSKTLHLSITRGETQYNLTGISAIIWTGASSSKKMITAGTLIDVHMLNDLTGPVIIPGTQETKTYVINVSSLGVVTKVSVAPVMTGNIDCKETDTKDVNSQ